MLQTGGQRSEETGIYYRKNRARIISATWQCCVGCVYIMTREKGELQWAGGNERRFVKDYKKYPCEQVLRGTCNQIICTKHEE